MMLADFVAAESRSLHYVILADHGRLAAATALGLAFMPVVQVFSLSEAQ
jgi:ParB-like chromosome segregation protein Spo0J